MVSTPETLIVALATPQGRGALATIRLSGAGAIALASRLAGRTHFAPRAATLVTLRLPPDDLTETALVTTFVAPQSFTGQECVEIDTHGGPVIVDAVLQACIDGGARLAREGEFTWRAYLNGRIDLLQAEAIADVIAATTRAQVRVASRHLEGALSAAIIGIGDDIARVRALLEASLDFPDEGFHFIERGDLVARLGLVHDACVRLLESADAGQRLHDGARVVIAGRPNAGKSSVFNGLLKRPRAIVTPVAGTTRDVLAEGTVFGGVPVQLIDTAGVRHTTDPVEQEGVARAEEATASASLVILVVDPSGTDEDREGSEALWATLDGRARLCVLNKMDKWRAQGTDASAMENWTPGASARGTHGVPDWCPADAIMVSALTGRGIDTLSERLAAELGQARWDGAILTRARHRSLVTACADAIARARATAVDEGSEEYILADLHDALVALEDLRGVETPDDVLETIFSSFCIGK
ncbi:MAG: tRNA uridine-5-carboxymethylaminomethyl(34) synthesis GTPase MnmE [Acidobacteria bacterium]|nr:tRNA uridine-5-carboxymethylaminomethyl(34) synthesis GTPase MnmE [Acidobacteriota bacterium]